jgi:phosphatidylinositol 4-kinase
MRSLKARPSTLAASPPFVVFAERWREKEARVAATSPHSHLPGWRLMPVIVKANDDLRQEQFAAQLLHQFAGVFRGARVPVWMRPYDILATCPDGGLIQTIPDTISIDSLKRGDPAFTTLDDWYERHFGHGARGAERVAAARLNFCRSMAAYSIVCYILNIKDRHNGNILIDRRGHIMHIDFGFLLTNSPGGNINFEAAPFKLTQEYVAVLGGPRSSLFATFRKLCIQAFLAARKYRERILLLVEMMLSGNGDLKCFVGGPRAVMAGLRARFHEDGSDRACVALVHRLIDNSLDNWRTRWYDKLQRWQNGVF